MTISRETKDAVEEGEYLPKGLGWSALKLGLRPGDALDDSEPAAGRQDPPGLSVEAGLAGHVHLNVLADDNLETAFVAEIRAGDQPMTMESDDGYVRLRPGPAAAPDLVLTGPPDGIIGLLSGRLDRRSAEDTGVRILGDERPLAQLRRQTA